MSYRGIRTLKFPIDMWNYQEIIYSSGIEWIIETGTRHGGSAVFFADQLGLLGRAGQVFTLDVAPQLQAIIDDHPKIQSFIGDSADIGFVSEVYARLPDDRGALFLILDSDHRADHVYGELIAHVPHLKQGDFVVVEDTIVNGHITRPDHGPGPMEGLERFLSEQPDQLVYDKERDEKFGPGYAWKGFYRKS